MPLDGGDDLDGCNYDIVCKKVVSYTSFIETIFLDPQLLLDGSPKTNHIIFWHDLIQVHKTTGQHIAWMARWPLQNAWS